MNTREQLLTEAARLLQVIIDRDVWADQPMRYRARCKLCGALSEFGEDDIAAIVHAEGCDLLRIQAWLAAWEVERQRPGQPAWINPPTIRPEFPIQDDDDEVDE